MNKSTVFCAVSLAFFVSTGVCAKTTNTIVKKTKPKVVHLKKSVATRSVTTNKDNTPLQEDRAFSSPVMPAANINNSPYHSYIESLTVSQNTKDLLYSYSNTPEGQKMLSRLINPSLVGPTGSSISSPIAFAADWGVISGGISYANRWPGTDDRDGLAGVSVGFGDAEEYAGFAVSVLVDSINPSDGGFAENGTVAAQLFHVFPNDFAVAIGAANVGPWGVFKDAAKSYYAVASKVFGVSIQERPMPLTLSLGAGTGAFHSVADAQEKHDASIQPFGSAGWQIFPQLSLIGEWAAKETNVGLSILPIAKWPVTLNIADCNVGRHDGKNSFFMISLAAGYSF